MKKPEIFTGLFRSWGFILKPIGLISFVLLGLGLSIGSAANLLTNPGFEDGSAGWSNRVRGGTAAVVTDPAIAHTGNNCISNYNATGWSSAAQGDSLSSAYGTGVSLPVSGTNYYKLSAYVKVPGASTTPRNITLRYRFEPSGNRVDVGTKSINTEAWTLLESPWIQPAAGDTYMSYWEVHSVDNAVIFYADDCGLAESSPFVIQGRVVDGGGAGVDGAVVVATSATAVSPSTTTASGGYYTLTILPDTGTYTVGASTPGFKGSTSVVVSASPTVAGDIVLGVDPDYDPNLLFAARSTSITAGAPWPTAFPAGGALTPISSPGVQSFGGVQWGRNLSASADGYLLGTYTAPIPVNGASIVVAVKPMRTASDNWDSIVDVFYNRLVLGIRNDTGLVNVWRNGTLTFSSAAIPDGQITVLSLVVQPTGQYKVWANGVEIMNDATTSDMTSLVPNVPGTFANAINVGRNNPDGWTAFNGYIGDVFVYKTALDDFDRAVLEGNLTQKFITDATLSYTITASPGSDGSITPSGPVTVLQGYNQTFTIAANPDFVIDDVLVDGSSIGTVTNYTFTNVSSNHTISATFTTTVDQTITATAGPGGTINPIGAITVPGGGSQTFTMLPDSGYVIADVRVDGVSKGATNPYTFSLVKASHTIAVTFAAISMNIPRTDQLLFAVITDSFPSNGLPTGPWATYTPSGQMLPVIGGTPTVEVIDGVKWEKNVSTNFDAFQYGTAYASPIPCSGATIIVAATRTATPSDNWDSIVDVFYDRLVLGIRNDTGQVNVRRNGSLDFGPEIPAGQATVLSLVVQPTGEYKVYTNGTEIMNITTTSDMTSLVPGVPGPFASTINIGRNGPDGWTTFNGNIGDVFLYKMALTDADRQQVENIVREKFAPVRRPTALITRPDVAGDVTITFNTVPGLSYKVEYTDSLSPMDWFEVFPGAQAANETTMSVVDTGAVAATPQRFYRVVQLP